MGAGSELTGIAVGGVFVGVTCPRLGAVASFEFLRRLLPGPFARPSLRWPSTWPELPTLLWCPSAEYRLLF